MIQRRNRNYLGGIVCFTVVVQLLVGATIKAEDGYRLWLRCDPLPKEMIEVYRPRVTSIVAPGGSATLEAIRSELTSGCAGLFGGAVPVVEKVERDGAVVVGTPKSSPLIAGLNTMVNEFKDKDVVFVAFATDQEKELREFLKTKAFDYQIIPNAETIHEKYDINFWPTHIILNRDGKLTQRITDGGINRLKRLRALINYALY